jgi:hypothetical protein
MCVMEIRALQVALIGSIGFMKIIKISQRDYFLLSLQTTRNAKQARVYVVPCKLICMRILRGIELELGGKVSARQDSIAAGQNVTSNHNAGQMINAKLSGPLYAAHVCGNAQINCGRGRLRICSGPARSMRPLLLATVTRCQYTETSARRLCCFPC